jgi:AAA+ ATPase superfamily predicted ATPase
MRNFEKGGLVSGMNPFIYGEEVEGENFCNRLNEIKALASEIESFQNILIYSPRRYGKTSLMNEVFKRLKKKRFLTFYIDLYPVVCEDDFIRISLKSISRVIGGTGKNILKRLKEYIKQISSSLFLTFSEDGTPSLGVNLSKTEILPALTICLTACTLMFQPGTSRQWWFLMSSSSWENWRTTGWKKS